MLPFNIVIPARLNSSRLRHKLLQIIDGKSVLHHTYLKAQLVSEANVMIAVDDEKLYIHAREFTDDVFMTPKSCTTGTDRIACLINEYGFNDYITVNWQADEPCIDPNIVRELVNILHQSGSSVATLSTEFKSHDAWLSQNNIKIVTDKFNHALYFSRAPIPSDQQEEWSQLRSTAAHHIGVYAFKNEFWQQFSEFSLSKYQALESLEQLRWLFNGIKIYVHKVPHYDSIGIDTFDDLQEFKNRILGVVK